jgi:hypothetical protein
MSPLLKTYPLPFASYMYKQRYALLLTFVYGLSVIFISSFHEVWRDEVRALSFVTERDSIFQIFRDLRSYNEGHPGLWYVILYIGFQLVQSTLVLKIASLAIATAAVYVFLDKAPFSWIQKILFIFGFFCLYEYSVISRNYGISMLLLFLFCSLYPYRFQKIYATTIVLFLLAHTNAYGLIIATAIFLSLIAETFFSRESGTVTPVRKSKIIFAMAFLALGILLSAFQMYPQQFSITTDVLSGPNRPSLLTSLLKTLFLPGEIFYYAFGFKPRRIISPEISKLIGIIAVTSIIWLYYIYLFRKRYIFIIFFLGTVASGLFSLLIIVAEVRHQGFIYLLIIVTLWLDHFVQPDSEVLRIKPLQKIAVLLEKNKGLLFSLLLIGQLFMAIEAVVQEINRNYSSSHDFAQYLKSRPELEHAIILGEPFELMEAMPYYVTNPIYNDREDRFGKIMHTPSTAKKKEMSLEELLHIAQRLRSESQEPVLIAMGYQLDPNGPFSIRFYFDRLFTYTPESLEKFSRLTERVADFRKAFTDENYTLYLLK